MYASREVNTLKTLSSKITLGRYSFVQLVLEGYYLNEF